MNLQTLTEELKKTESFDTIDIQDLMDCLSISIIIKQEHLLKYRNPFEEIGLLLKNNNIRATIDYNQASWNFLV